MMASGIEKGDIVRYWRDKGGWALGEWMDESRPGSLVKVRPIGYDGINPKLSVSEWVLVDHVKEFEEGRKEG